MFITLTNIKTIEQNTFTNKFAQNVSFVHLIRAR